MTRPTSGKREDSSTRIFGPVPSRRLGLSLGVDVVPYKTCTFDCVYCECGATTRKTCARETFYDPRAVLDELEGRLSRAARKPDVVTLSGSGEPTLYRGMGELIEGAKRLTGLPFAVITNGSLLWMEDVREELSRADIVLPSLDAAVEEDYRRVNRPHEACTLERLIGGLETFLASYRGTVLLEVLVVGGYNAGEANLAALRETIGRLRADRVQLNTAVRPGTERDALPLDAETLERIRRSFGPRCELIAPSAAPRARHEEAVMESAVLDLLSRRPCTVSDMHASFGGPSRRIDDLLRNLLETGAIEAERRGNEVFYRRARTGGPDASRE